MTHFERLILHLLIALSESVRAFLIFQQLSCRWHQTLKSKICARSITFTFLLQHLNIKHKHNILVKIQQLMFQQFLCSRFLSNYSQQALKGENLQNLIIKNLCSFTMFVRFSGQIVNEAQPRSQAAFPFSLSAIYMGKALGTRLNEALGAYESSGSHIQQTRVE